MNNDTPTKRCSKCGIEKPRTTKYFHRQSYYLDGFSYYCKACWREIRGSKRRYENPYAGVKAGNKRCNVCREEKPLSQFHRNKRTPDGIARDCIDCHRTAKGVIKPRGINAIDGCEAGYKRCKTCKEVLPATNQFFYAGEGYYGLVAHCKDCRRRKLGQEKKFSPYENLPDGYRRCVTCLGVKENTDENFTRFGNRCKTCLRRYSVFFRAENAEVIKERRKVYHADNREARNAYSRENYRKNIETYRQQRRVYQRRYKAKYPEYMREWREANREHLQRYNRISGHLRRARQKLLITDWLQTDYDFAIGYWHGCCAICNRPLVDLFGDRKLAMDHWIPVVSPECPGTVPHNMLPLCHGVDGCNNKKWAHDPTEWLTQKLGKRKAKQKLREIETYFELVRRDSVPQYSRVGKSS